MKIKNLTAEQFESRLIALEALSEGNRFKESSADQRYIAQLRAMLLYSLYSDELTDADKVVTEESVISNYTKISDEQLRHTVRDLILD